MRCRWSPVALFVILGSAVVAPAQPPREPTDGKVVIPMTVSASPAPKLALKYQLLPELRDSLPGNQIPAFYKCFMEQHHLYRSKEVIAEREKWLAAPLADLAGEKGIVGYGGSSTKQADYAAHLDNVDWAVLSQLQKDGIGLLLPDVQQLRELAAVLKVKVRGEIARGEFDAAVRTTKVLFALSRAFESHPTLIGQLVGIAIATIALDGVEEFVQQPGAPNLFWALTDLPDPFMDLRKGMQGERTWLGREFDVLKKSAPASDADLKKLADFAEPVFQVRKDGGPWATFQKLAADPAAVTAARRRLTAFGLDPAKLSPVHAVMSDDFMKAMQYQDELMKWTNVPYWKLPADYEKSKAPAGVFTELPAALVRVKQAQTRLQQRVALVTVIEGIRLHAGEHGKVPGALDAVKLPLPVDPFTGKAFVYEVKGGVGVLRATPPADMAKNPVYNRVYEITIRK